MRIRPLTLLPLLVAAPALAEMPPGVSHFTLPNGLEAVVIEDHRAPVVVQMVWYKIGSVDEVPGKSGIAHYLEHLMFKGTDTLKPGELSKIVTANGGMDNAFTSYDYTAYFQRIAADRLPLVMRMEADRMANLRIGEDDWKAERQVVLEERAQRTDSDPRALFQEEAAAVQFYNHGYGRPVIGWRAEMEGLTRDDALAWYGAHYAPNAAVLVVAGDVTVDQVKKLAEEYYGPIPAKPGAERKARPQEPDQRTARRMQMTDPRVPQPVLTRSMLAPERNPGDQKKAAALTVLAELLAGSPQTSALGKSLVLGGKALFVDAGYDGFAVDRTTFTLSMVPVPGLSQAEAEAALDGAVAQFLKDGPDPAALERVRAQLHAARIYEQDSAHGRAYDYGQGLATGLTVEDVNAWPDLLAAVTAEDVAAVAREVLGQPGTVTGWLLPDPAASDQPKADMATLVAPHAAVTEAPDAPRGAAPAVEAGGAPAAAETPTAEAAAGQPATEGTSQAPADPAAPAANASAARPATEASAAPADPLAPPAAAPAPPEAAPNPGAAHPPAPRPAGHDAPAPDTPAPDAPTPEAPTPSPEAKP